MFSRRRKNQSQQEQPKQNSWFTRRRRNFKSAMDARAEKARQAKAAKEAEKARKAEEARQAEEDRKAEEAMKAEEARKAEEAMKAEEARQAEEARKAEEARQAEEAKKAEEEKAEAAEDAVPDREKWKTRRAYTVEQLDEMERIVNYQYDENSKDDACKFVETLGVDPTKKAAVKRLNFKYHPDSAKNFNSLTATDLFKKVGPAIKKCSE